MKTYLIHRNGSSSLSVLGASLDFLSDQNTYVIRDADGGIVALVNREGVAAVVESSRPAGT